MRNGYTSFSQFALGMSEFPLPIELKFFKGEWANNAVQLHWETTSEYKNDYFLIERSTNAVDFNGIGRVDGSGYSSELNEYTFTDAQIRSSIYYYRLKQVDFDGTTYDKGIIAVSCPIFEDEARVYPQPATNLLFIEFHALRQGNIEVTITNSLGQPVHIQNMPVDKGDQLLEMDCESVPEGWYILKITDGQQTLQQPVIIK